VAWFLTTTTVESSRSVLAAQRQFQPARLSRVANHHPVPAQLPGLIMKRRERRHRLIRHREPPFVCKSCRKNTSSYN
jgi:hypothetical protein